MVDFEELTIGELEALAEAGAEALTCQRALARTGDTVVGELLREAGPLYEWQHYPQGDVYDSESHAQYYYHCHAAAERREGEHGHFHTFLRPLGMPEDVRPVEIPGVPPPSGPNDALSHLIGLAVDEMGRPVRLFTTNRWVTGETWYAGADVVRMLDSFVIAHTRPSWPANRWITAAVRLFRPQIVALLGERDEAVGRRVREIPLGQVLEDRSLEVPSECAVDLDAQIAGVGRALAAKGRPAR